MIPEAEGDTPMADQTRHLIELPDNIAEMSDEELDALADRIYEHITKAPSE